MLGRVVIILGLGVINAILFSKMIWGPTGIMEYRALKAQHAALLEKIATLDGENINLSREIRLMQSDEKYTEKMVRQKLHYLRDNEIVYLFAKSAEPAAGDKANDRKN